ncbi:SAF domain-containing protein [Buchananella felis]|uniref:SAF domain-containing protein n=1 Tax=Buchananella felis TaxID=3231492 RepID=UPI003526CECF
MRTLFSRYGRLLAVIAVVAALLVAWTAMRPPTRTAVVLVDDVAAGQPIAAAALAVRPLSVAGVPADSIGVVAEASGRVAAVDLRAGTVLSHSLLLGAQRPFVALPGQVLVPVEVDDPVTWQLARVGDSVRVLLPASGLSPPKSQTGEPPVVLAHRATLIGRVDQSAEVAEQGLLGGVAGWESPGLSTRRFFLLSAEESAASMIVSRRGEGRPALLLLGPDSSRD